MQGHQLHMSEQQHSLRASPSPFLRKSKWTCVRTERTRWLNLPLQPHKLKTQERTYSKVTKFSTARPDDLFVRLFVLLCLLVTSPSRHSGERQKTQGGMGKGEASARLAIISSYDTPEDQKQWAADCLINWELTLQYALNYDSLLSLDPVWK